MFGQKPVEKVTEPISADPIRGSGSKDRARLLSNPNSWSQQQLTPQSGQLGNNSFSNRQIINSTSTNQVVRQEPLNSDRDRKIFSGQNQQLENVVTMRQFCIFYHYYLVELFVQLNYIKISLGHLELLLRLYYALGLLIKYKSTYCISIMSIQHKYLSI
jgi:hypothetical protein